MCIQCFLFGKYEIQFVVLNVDLSLVRWEHCTCFVDSNVGVGNCGGLLVVVCLQKIKHHSVLCVFFISVFTVIIKGEFKSDWLLTSDKMIPTK